VLKDRFGISGECVLVRMCVRARARVPEGGGHGEGNINFRSSECVSSNSERGVAHNGSCQRALERDLVPDCAVLIGICQLDPLKGRSSWRRVLQWFADHTSFSFEVKVFQGS
jgi:hypothetical protein